MMSEKAKANNVSPPKPLPSDNCQSVPCSTPLFLTYKWDNTVFVFLWLVWWVLEFPMEPVSNAGLPGCPTLDLFK